MTLNNGQDHDGAELPGVDPSGAEVPPPSNPMAVARHLAPAWLHEDADGQRVLTLRHWRGTWMRWFRCHWVELSDAEIRAELYQRLEHTVYVHTDSKGGEELRSWAPTRRKMSDLLEASAAVTHLPPFVDAPAWISEPGEPGERLPFTRTDHIGPVVACANGLLIVSERHLIDLTPRFFNQVSVPFNYDPNATAPMWLEFLHRVWPDDPQAIDALQEWFGYVLSGRTDQQKILLIVGPTRSGKGTIARVLTSLVGKNNIAGPTLASLATNFGISPLLGKPLAVISDARLGGRDRHQVVERLLTISGEDTIDVDRKYRQPWTGKLPTRLMILSNELPSFGDSSGVIAQRFLVFTMQASWLGKEDTGLTGKLTAELPGILNWALDGLERLEAKGRFTMPASSEDAVTTMQDTASPTSAFVREVCTLGENYLVPIEDLWEAWKRWCDDSGNPAGTKSIFGRNLQSVAPRVKRIRPRLEGPGTPQVPCYEWITLTAAKCTAHNGEYAVSPVSTDNSAGQSVAAETGNSNSPVSAAQPEQGELVLSRGLRRAETGNDHDKTAGQGTNSAPETGETANSPLWAQHNGDSGPACDTCGMAPSRIDGRGARRCQRCAPHLWKASA